MSRKSYQKITSTDKKRLRDVYTRGGNFADLAKFLKIDRTTAYFFVFETKTRDHTAAKDKHLIKKCATSLLNA